MTVVNNASVIFKDKNGNVGKVKAPSANDITKISTAISDVAKVVDPTSHLPIKATTSSVGVVQLADSAAVAAGTAGRIIDAAKLKDAIEHVTPADNLMTTDTAQTITGVKTFSALPQSSVAPTTDDQLANKKYVDDSIPDVTNMVTTDGAQTITGVKTFSALPQSSVIPTSNNDLVNKAYVDAQSGGGGLGDYVPGQLVISSIPLTDARLHLADGSLLSGTGTYADFVSYMADLYADDPTNACFTTEANWQVSVTNTGSCGKFVYDSVNNTLRLPKYDARYLKSTLSASDLGDLVEATSPNIKGYLHIGNASDATPTNLSNSSGALGIVNKSNKLTYQTATAVAYPSVDFDFDASRSSSVYKDSATTIDTDAVKVYYYIVLGTVSKTQIQIDIDQIATDLNGKAGVDFANINNTAKIAIAHNAMPSDKYDDLTLGASGTDYTAPADGYVALSKATNADGQWAVIAGENMRIETSSPTPNIYGLRIFLPVRKGEIFNITYSAAGATSFFRFVYAVGSKSEQ